MMTNRPPYWFWRLDRWKLLAALLLGLLALLMALRGCGTPKATLPEVKLPKLTLPSLAGLKAGAPFDLEGTAEPGAKVKIYDGDKLLGETVAGPDGKWKFTLPALAAGAHTIAARLFDANGKEIGASEPWTFELPEVKLPKLTLPDLAGLRAGAPFDLEGTAEPGAKVKIYDGDKLLGETIAGPDGKWKFTLPALAAGAHTIAARLFDADGKEIGASEPWTFELPETEASPYPTPYAVTLKPGETLSVPVRGYCLNYGRPFPGRSLSAVDMAPDKVRSAIAYAVEKGYVDSDPLQVQLAVWYLTDGKRLEGQTYGIADEIISFVEGAPVPEPDGIKTLAAALMDKLVSATIGDFTSTSPANFPYQGEGALLLENLSGEEQTLILPYGFRFRDTGRTGVQDMGVFPIVSP